MDEHEILRLSLIKINTPPHANRERVLEVKTLNADENEILITRVPEQDLLSALQAFLNRID